MDTLIPLPFAIPFTVAAVLVAGASRIPRWLSDAIALLTGLVALVICVILAVHVSIPHIYWFGDWTPRFVAGQPIAIGICFVADRLGAAMAAFVALITTASFLYSASYFKEVKTFYHALMLLFMGSMIGFCLTGDLFNLFVFFELMSVAAYALTGYKTEEPGAIEGAINFAVINSLAGCLILFGIGLIYGHTGALNMAQVGHALAQEAPGPLVKVALALLLGGLLVKAAVVPFHFWLTDAHAVAPTPVCVIFSGIMVELGVYGALRIYWSCFHDAMGGAMGGGMEQTVMRLFLAGGALTGVVGTLMCLTQRHIKRLFASSTLAHVGIMMVGAGLLEKNALVGVVIYIASHGLIKAALFMGSGILLHRLNSVDAIDLYGRGRGLGWAPLFIFILCGIGLSGPPPFGTWVGKALIEEAAKADGLLWVPAFLILISSVSSATLVRTGAQVLLGWGPPPKADTGAPTEKESSETEGGHEHTPWLMGATPILLILISVLPGVFLSGALWTSVGADTFVHPEQTNQIVLHDAQVSGPLGEPFHPKPASIISAVLCGLITILVSILLTYFPAMKWGALKRPLTSIGFAINKVHSGNVSDYVAWFVLGVGLVAVYMLL